MIKSTQVMICGKAVSDSVRSKIRMYLYDGFDANDLRFLRFQYSYIEASYYHACREPSVSEEYPIGQNSNWSTKTFLLSVHAIQVWSS